jgi:tRNA-2-methylthio-N6-dimethylallyladenosine synthase
MKYYIETYGCQMNVSDSEVVSAILNDNGFVKASTLDEADIILVNTCSIRENAEIRVRGRLKIFNQLKKTNNRILVGVLGCMAERLKEELANQEKMVDLVVGPDSYRLLPQLIEQAQSGKKQIEVMLSDDETYEDIIPVRYDSKGVSAFVAIMRGCENMCSYCIVPYVRGVERSRNTETVLNEIREVQQKGYKEVTLIGQNVDSYIYKDISFANLLAQVATAFPQLRIRFSTNHPKDLSDEVLKTMAAFENICKHIHLPVQSGSNHTLQLMNRGYTREYYLERMKAIHAIVPECAISTDIMVGFCDETDEDQNNTLSLMKEVGYDFAFMFKYSERSGTYAARNLKDNVPEKVKINRLNEVIFLQNELSAKSKAKDVGKMFEVLVEGTSKKSAAEYMGRNSQNKVLVFPSNEKLNAGDTVWVRVERYTSATLIGSFIKKKS